MEVESLTLYEHSSETCSLYLVSIHTSTEAWGVGLDLSIEFDRAISVSNCGVCPSRCASPWNLRVAPTRSPARRSRMASSTLAIRALRCLFPMVAGAKSSGKSWLTQGVRRRSQLMHVSACGDAKRHRILRRLHSQHERVPLRIFLRVPGAGWLGGGGAACSSAVQSIIKVNLHRGCATLLCVVVLVPVG